MKTRQQRFFQIIYGGVLILAGVGVFYRIPQVMPEVATVGSLGDSMPFVKICFYLLGCLLIGGGIKKIHANFKKTAVENKQHMPE